MPKVSVIIPTYNCEKFIQEAIDSVLNQNYQDMEIIVVNDGSTDNTEAVLKPYIEFGKIKYFSQKNSGPSAARNKGITEAEGEYVAFLDADDLWMKDYLSKGLKLLNENESDLVMTDNYIDVYTEDNKLIQHEYANRKNYLGNENKLYEILFQRFQEGFDGELRIIVRKKCFDQTGLFDEKLRILEDWELWLRFAKNKFKVEYIQEPLFVYRRHPNATCRNKKNDRTRLFNIYSAFNKHRKEAFKVNEALKKSYSQTLWMIGAESIVGRIDILFGIKCILESQWYYFNKRKILKLIKKYLKL